MKNKRFFRSMIALLLVACNISCDQVSKNIARENIDHHQYIEVISDMFVLTKVENSGAFLGLGNEWPEPVKWVFLAGIPLLILSYGLYVLLSEYHISYQTALGLGFAIGGGFGNLYDRFVFGSVTDFMHIDVGFFRTGIFNMADVSITIGVILLFADVFFHRRKKDSRLIASAHSD